MRRIRNLFLSVLAFSLSSCQVVQNRALHSVADMLASPEGSSIFASDDDPRLVGDSLPLALKLYEIVLDNDPENADLAAATGRNFVMYAAAYVQMPADMLDTTHWKEADEARKRAKKLYLRGRKYLLEALELRHEGFRELLESGSYDQAISLLNEEDADTVYWAALAWMGMASTDPLDIELALSLDKAALLLFRSMQLDETNSGIHDVMIQVYMSLPTSILVSMQNRSPLISEYIDSFYTAAGVGSDAEERAMFHYNQAVYLTDGKLPAPHVTMATAVSVKKQDAEGFRTYLEKAMAINPDDNPQSRLMILIYQGRARWLLENIELFFLEF